MMVEDISYFDARPLLFQFLLCFFSFYFLFPFIFFNDLIIFVVLRKIEKSSKNKKNMVKSDAEDMWMPKKLKFKNEKYKDA